MALGEDEADAEVSVNTKVPSCGRWNSGKLLPPGLEPEQPLHLDVEGGPLWRAEADPGYISGVFLSQTHTDSKEPVADRSEPHHSGPLPSASVGTGELLHPVGSQVSMEGAEAGAELGLSFGGVHSLSVTLCPTHCKLGALCSRYELFYRFSWGAELQVGRGSCVAISCSQRVTENLLRTVTSSSGAYCPED